MTLALQHLPNGAYPSVHHVGGRDDVRAGVGADGCLSAERLHRDVVEHVSAFVDDSVLAVGCVGIKGRVGHDAEIG